MMGSGEMPADISDTKGQKAACQPVMEMPAKSPLEVVISGTARDCAQHLPDVLNTMARVGDRFRKATFIVAENDSRDATRSRNQTGRGFCGCEPCPEQSQVQCHMRTRSNPAAPARVCRISGAAGRRQASIAADRPSRRIARG